MDTIGHESIRWQHVRPLIIGLLSVIVILIASPGTAHVVSKQDGNDASGKMDIASSFLKHKSGKYVVGFKTQGTWSLSDVFRTSSSSSSSCTAIALQMFDFDTRGNSAADYRILTQAVADPDTGEFAGYTRDFWKVQNGSWQGVVEDTFGVLLITDNSMSVKFPQSSMIVNKALGWKVVQAQSVSGDPCSPQFHDDHAPNDLSRWYRHN